MQAPAGSAPEAPVYVFFDTTRSEWTALCLPPRPWPQNQETLCPRESPLISYIRTVTPLRIGGTNVVWRLQKVKGALDCRRGARAEMYIDDPCHPRNNNR